MSDIAESLRLLLSGKVEGKITALHVTPAPTEFSSQLSTENTRKAVYVYNNSDSSSGDCFYGYHDHLSPSGENLANAGQPIPVGAKVAIPVTTDVSFYLCASSGELGNLRVEEIA